MPSNGNELKFGDVKYQPFDGKIRAYPRSLGARLCLDPPTLLSIINHCRINNDAVSVGHFELFLRFGHFELLSNLQCSAAVGAELYLVYTD